MISISRIVLVVGILTNSCTVRQFVHGQTYQAHPVVCAAALKVQHIIQEEGLVRRVKIMGDVLESKLKRAFESHPFVGDIRGRGLFWAVSHSFPGT